MPFNSLHHLLGSLEAQYQSPERRQFQRLLAVWGEVVGAVVAAQTRPLSIQRGVLRVATASSAWAQNLVFERQRILEKLNARLVLSLEDIRFSTAQWQESQPLLAAGTQEQEQLWREHPSRLGQAVSLPLLPSENADSLQGFDAWAQVVRSQSHCLPLCPRCQCPTPSGEIERWQVCAHCIAQQWRS